METGLGLCSTMGEEKLEMTSFAKQAVRASSVASSSSSRSARAWSDSQSSASTSRTSAPSSLDVPVPDQASRAESGSTEETGLVGGNSTIEPKPSLQPSAHEADPEVGPVPQTAEGSTTHLWSLALQMLGQLQEPASAKPWALRALVVILSFTTILGVVATCFASFRKPDSNWAQEELLNVQKQSLEKQKRLLDQQQEMHEMETWKGWSIYVQTCLVYAGRNVTSDRCQAAIKSFDRPPPQLPSSVVKDLTRRQVPQYDPSKPTFTSASYIGFWSGLRSLPSPEKHPLRLLPIIVIPFTGLVFLMVAMLSRRFNGARPFKLPGQQNRHDVTSSTSPPNQNQSSDEPAIITISGPRTTALDGETNNQLKRRGQKSHQSDNEGLWEAALKGDLEGIQRHLNDEHCPDINTIHGLHGTPLQAAATGGHVPALEMILDKQPLVDVTGGLYSSPLQAAAHSGNLKMVQILLERSSPINVPGGYYGSALHAAAKQGSVKMVETLMDAGAAIIVDGGLSGSPLHMAATRGALDIVECLLQRGADVHAQRSNGTTALHDAVTFGRVWVVQRLLDTGADVDADSEPSGTPFRIASLSGFKTLASICARYTADVKRPDKNGRTLLHDAAHAGHVDLVRRRLNLGADVSAKDKDGLQPLSYAAMPSDSDVIDSSLAAEAPLNAQDIVGDAALLRTIRDGNFDIQGRLAHAGPDFGFIDSSHKSRFPHVTRLARAESVQLLLKAGSPLSAQDLRGNTALHIAVNSGNLCFQQLLIQAGADVGVMNLQGEIPLHIAVRSGRLESHKAPSFACIQAALIQAGADVNALNSGGMTPLHAAAGFDHLDSVKLLLRAGSGIDAQDLSGRTPLYTAILKNCTHVPKYLIQAGADVNPKGGLVGTALAAAASRGRIGVVEAMLDNGANVNWRSGVYDCALLAAEADSTSSGEINRG
ncbi:MAG: hypothetical protein M1823_003604 [Watsoniomyces obsoletus]|nr:MAG: hypothetical protein M1823_003604 [Watsoniomyces obsoletus]